MRDLNSQVSLRNGLMFSEARAINNANQVPVSVTSIPEPESYALFLAGVGLTGFIARRKRYRTRTEHY